MATDNDGSGSVNDTPSNTESYTVASTAVTVGVPTPVITTIGTASDLRVGEGMGVTFATEAAGSPTFTWTINGSDDIAGDSAGRLTLTWSDLVGHGVDDKILAAKK